MNSVRFFNSHPHKEDDVDLDNIIGGGILFNSHPHKEDDNGEIEPASAKKFSTHILTRRMTDTMCPFTVSSYFQLTSSQGG